MKVKQSNAEYIGLAAQYAVYDGKLKRRDVHVSLCGAIEVYYGG